MKVLHIPFDNLPRHGGVRQHVRLLLAHMPSQGVEFVKHMEQADLVHVQTAYPPPRRVIDRLPVIDVMTCHGGFIPPIPQVRRNLYDAKMIISVARWIVDHFFPEYAKKTVVIPNGLDLNEWTGLPPSGLEPGYVLWGSMHDRADWNMFYKLATERIDLRFVSTLRPRALKGLSLPPNLHTIGLQPYSKFRSIVNDAAVVVSCGSEVCPTLVLEAWACGKPVLAWNGHGNAELLNKHVAGGYLYDNFGEMSAGLEMLLLQSPKADEERREIVRQNYTWDKIAKKTMKVYERCLDT